MAVESREVDSQEPVRTEAHAKRVRTYLGGELIADTIRPTLVWEVPYYPAYYFPERDVRMELLTPTGRTERSPSRGEARYFTVAGGARVAEDAAWYHPDSPVAELRGLIRFDWDAMDAWFEEDEEVYFHPRSPYHRVDILASSRHVEVVVNRVKVADSHHPRLLFQTGLPTRYYLPLVDVRMELLRPSATTTGCAYKGTAGYWSVEADGEVFEDLVWTYKTPLPESVKIAGLASFYSERVDTYVDGVLQEQPRTMFRSTRIELAQVTDHGEISSGFVPSLKRDSVGNLLRCPRKPRRSQPIKAPFRAKTLQGLSQPSVWRGRRLSSRTTASRSACVAVSAVRRGTYGRKGPLVFSTRSPAPGAGGGCGSSPSSPIPS